MKLVISGISVIGHLTAGVSEPARERERKRGMTTVAEMVWSP